MSWDWSVQKAWDIFKRVHLTNMFQNKQSVGYENYISMKLLERWLKDLKHTFWEEMKWMPAYEALESEGQLS